jgi:murein DD-endopeptidase MepM/ murein hydrolase activator NlpD
MSRILGFLLIPLILFTSCNSKGEGKDLALEAEGNTSKPKPRIEFGFNLDTFNIVSDTVRKGDSFGEIMSAHSVAYPKIATVAERFKDTFDVRRIRVGKPYFILKSKDSIESTQVFIYQNDLINFTVIDFRDSVLAYRGKRNIKTLEREIAGVIPDGGSLSLVIDDQGVDYRMTLELSQVFAWTIDFSKLDAGDKFRVIFEEKYIQDSIYAGAGPIKAAYFEHKGKEFYAFSHWNDSLDVLEYYDDKAENLRRTFLRMPIQFGRLSSRYNLKRRIRYYGYQVRPHKGTDYAAPIGTPILATADGVVTESTRKGGNGKYVKIRHNETYSTQYLHMKAQNVKRGEYVRQGDVIGWIGMTGNTGGPHVCYRFWKNGRQVDPLREELPAAEPLAEKLRPAFYDKIRPLKVQLDCIPIQDLGNNTENLITAN